MILWLLLLLSSFGADVLGTVRGVVYDDASATPLSDVDLICGDVQVTTDARGRFAFHANPGVSQVMIKRLDGAEHPGPNVLVVAGLTTELLLTVSSTGRVRHAWVDAPSAALAIPVNGVGVSKRLLRGVVQSSDGDAVRGAMVFVRGSAQSTASRDDGSFVIEVVQDGWELAIVAHGYEATTLSSTAVSDEHTGPVTVVLEARGFQLDDYYVQAPSFSAMTALSMERVQASSFVDVMGVKDMARSGSSNVASALRRMPGVTIIDGKYVYVRGLGGRYIGTLLNGSMVPSPEPDKRAVPLDIFPTALIESIVVQKTFSPDVPGEFAGGLVKIRTKSIPDSRVLSFKLTGAFRQGVSFGKSLWQRPGPTDFLGFGAKYRDLPEIIRDLPSDQPIKPSGLLTKQGYSAEQLERFGEAMPNRWALKERTIPLDMSFRATVGDYLETTGPRIGFYLSSQYTSRWSNDHATRHLYSHTGDDLALRKSTAYDVSNHRTQWGGMLVLGAVWDHHKIDATTMIQRVSTKDVGTYHVDDPTSVADSRSYNVGWRETQFVFQQLKGQHEFPRLSHFKIDWNYAFSSTRTVEPGRRAWTFADTSDGLRLSQKGTWNDTSYTALQDRQHQARVDLSLDVLASRGTRPGVIKVGLWGRHRHRTSSARRFSYEFRGTEGLDLSRPIHELLVPEHIGASSAEDRGYLVMYEQTSNADDYAANQAVVAAYAMADLPFTRRFRSMFGARLEHSEQVVQTFELFSADSTRVEGRLKTLDVLPAFMATIGVGPKGNEDRMMLQTSYGRTVSRPLLREMSSVPYYDYRSGVLNFGNEGLRRAVIDHVDLRWIWTPEERSRVSLAGFFKHFKDPIESVAKLSAVSGAASTFANVGNAQNLGVELDFRLQGGLLHHRLENFYLSGNAAWIFSRVDLSGQGGTQTQDVRPLQGQSPWIVNAQFGFDDEQRGIQVGLLYNVFGRRLREVGQSGIPDSYELPVHRLGLVGNFLLGSGWTFQIKGTNLLDWPVVRMTGDQRAESTRSGARISLGIQWSLGAPKAAQQATARR